MLHDFQPFKLLILNVNQSIDNLIWPKVPWFKIDKKGVLRLRLSSDAGIILPLLEQSKTAVKMPLFIDLSI